MECNSLKKQSPLVSDKVVVLDHFCSSSTSMNYLLYAKFARYYFANEAGILKIGYLPGLKRDDKNEVPEWLIANNFLLDFTKYA